MFNYLMLFFRAAYQLEDSKTVILDWQYCALSLHIRH